MGKGDNKQFPTISLEIDPTKYQSLIDKELDKQARETITQHLNFLFINPVMEQARYNYLKERTHNDQDLAAGHNFIKGIIDKKILDDSFQDYINNYIERNFPRILDEALEKALGHKANALAFRAAKGKLPLTEKVHTNAELREYVDKNVSKA